MEKYQLNSDQIADSWIGKFTFQKETDSKPGLRSPQIGALYALMAHAESGEESAIVVMPTGTGKTETMLSFLIANVCRKVFVVVPSDALRSQTYKKFKSLGLLPKLGVVPSDINLPIVTMITKGMTDDEWIHSINSSNVIITTMALASTISGMVRCYIRDNVSYTFIDEAHHSKAETWDSFIKTFPPSKVVMFTATPFRNDGQKLAGKIVFNFSLRKAQEQHYYEQINNYQITKYNTNDADKAIAKKAVEILRSDLNNGYDHIIMARCKSKARAQEVYKVYQQYEEFNPIVVYSGMPKGTSILKAIKEKKHRIIVCVNMLGEGYDLPQLKIAAIHDEKQSLAVTLQFIGRFTRTNDLKLGKASFITNIAYPPIKEEINSLYQIDADWNYILPRINDDVAFQQESLSDFLNGFRGDLKKEISLEDIRPALSAEVYITESTTSSFNNWKNGLTHIDKYDYALHSISNDTLVVVLGKKSCVLWGDTKTVENLTWDIIIVYFDTLNKRIYLNSSIKLRGEKFLRNIFTNPIKIQNDCLFRVFVNIHRLRLFSVGARLPQGKDVSFQSYFGRSVQDGIDLLSQGKLLKNNVFGVGYKNGILTSIGCSSKGKVWSRERCNLLYFQKWCREIGKIIFDETIDTNIILQNMLSFEILKKWPTVHPISIDWNPEMYEHYTQQVHFGNSIMSFDEIEMKIESDTSIGDNIIFSLSTGDFYCKYKIDILNTNESESFIKYNYISGDSIKFIRGNGEVELNEYLIEFPPTIYYADNSISYGRHFCKPKYQAEEIPDSMISTLKWENVNISKESQGSAPYYTDSIQYYMAKTIIDKHDFLIDDDGSGEVADLIGIDNSDHQIDVTLYHLKYAKGRKVSQRIDNLYEVCGQAQKSIRWKYVGGQKIFQHILQRNELKEKKGKSSSLLKGSINDIIKLREEASNKKELKFHVIIVQPGMSKSSSSREMRILLGNTVQVLHEMANIDCHVICSD